ncbi:hypothetical protein QE359_002971 [Curtobacterium sp. SORGH_AS776]|nr:hypothetical protein [Curtobacterium sp. SORGH_AS_0776]
MSRVPEDTISRGLPGETVQPAPRTRREARERYRGSERRQARGLPSTSTGARSLRQAAKPGASLGAGYLGLGAAVLTGIEAVAGIVFFLIRWTEFTDPWLPAAAWALYLVAAVGVGLSLLTYGERLTGLAFALICVVLGCVVTLDFIGIWPEHDIAHSASASVAAGFALLPVATLRPAREVAGRHRRPRPRVRRDGGRLDADHERHPARDRVHRGARDRPAVDRALRGAPVPPARAA